MEVIFASTHESSWIIMSVGALIGSLHVDRKLEFI